MHKVSALYITNLGLLDNLAQTQILPYLEGLSKKGVRMSILSFEKKEYLANSSDVKTVKDRLDRSGIAWEHLIYHRRWGNAWDVLRGMIRSYGMARAAGVEIIHARASIPILIAWPVAKMLGKKLIYDRRGTMAGDFIDDVNVKNVFSVRAFSSFLEAVDDFMIRHSDATIVLSKRSVEMMRSDPHISGSGAATEWIPCCVDIAKFESPKPGTSLGLGGKFAMSYVGSLGTCYLLEEMARFYKALKRIEGRSVFRIISHTQGGYIEGVLGREGLAKGSDYTIIDASPDEVPAYLAGSRCSIMFIKPVDCKIGSSPTKFGESLAAGIPVIVNKGIGDTEEVIRSRRVGVVVESLDEEGYKRALDELLSLCADPGVRTRCIAAARELLSLEMGVDRYAGVYDNIMGPR